MPTIVTEQTVSIPRTHDSNSLLHYFKAWCDENIRSGNIPIRFVVSRTTPSTYDCEVATVSGLHREAIYSIKPIFDFRRRSFEITEAFNVVLLVPTGIGAEIGGHAGDAAPVSKLLGSVADTIVVHPNVVNASDLNEMPQNALYVEGSVLTRLLMGTIGLRKVRANRVLVAIDEHKDELFVNAAVNAVNGARAAGGFVVPEIVCLQPPIRLHARFAGSGRAAGTVDDLEALLQAIESRSGLFDAIAISSVIDVPHDFHQGYFDAAGEMVNPWGGVEAMLTHMLSSIYNLPTAHSPMFESRAIANMDPGVVDARMAAEAVSTTFLQCTLKGLQRSPQIVDLDESSSGQDIFRAENVSCVVMPDKCLGLPTLAALEQGITVIAVRENQNIMQNELMSLPWKPGQFHIVDNYWEAAGVIAAIRAGIDPLAVRRPFVNTLLSRHEVSRSKQSMPPIAIEAGELPV